MEKISPEVAQLIRTVQNRCRRVIEMESYSFEPVYDFTRKRFFARFNEWFPNSKIKQPGESSPQLIRHGIVMALTGFAIDSMAELPQVIWEVLDDVCRTPESRYLTESISAELSNIIEDSPFSNPWEILDWVEEVSVLPDMSETDIPF